MNTNSFASPGGPADTDAARENARRRYLALATDWRDNPELRSRAESDAAGVLAERGIDVPSGFDIRLVANTPETCHVVLPPDSNAALADGDLAGVAGGTGHDAVAVGGTVTQYEHHGDMTIICHYVPDS